MYTGTPHYWIVAPYLLDRQKRFLTFTQECTHYTINCHQTLRGPYTGIGSLLRQLVPVVYQQQPEEVQNHTQEILSVAPELSSLLPLSTQTLTSLAEANERTRFYSHVRTLRLTHGIIDFLKNCLSLHVFHHLTLYFENVHAADPLDQELLGHLLRRANSESLTIVIGTVGEDLPSALKQALQTYTSQIMVEPTIQPTDFTQLQNRELPKNWQQWLSKTAQGWSGEYVPLQDAAKHLASISPGAETFSEGMRLLIEQVPDEIRLTWAKAYISSECTSDILVELLAYQTLDTLTRQQWHDDRAQELEMQEQVSLRLGAIPYHYEHGTTPADRGAAALQFALTHCLNMGFHEAVVDMGKRGREVSDPVLKREDYWNFTVRSSLSLALLGHPEDADKLYSEIRALYISPTVHMKVAYAIAMHYTRYYQNEQRDHILAKAWINLAIAIATQLPDPKARIFHTAFNKNGLALVESHLGHLHQALRLVTEGLESLESEFEPEEYLLQRSILRYNRAQVYASMGQLENALTDFSVLITSDPHYSEYYFDRGNVNRRLGRNEDALSDFQAAIIYSSPYLEAYYNRAGTLSLLGRDEEALADYNYVLELEPNHLNSLINRASIYYEQEEYALARQDIEYGLSLAPENAGLFCTLGLLEMAQKCPVEAEKALSCAIEYDKSLVAAWTNRAILAFESGRVEAALQDLTHAFDLGENATVLYNRGIAHQALGNWSAAIEDFTHNLRLDNEDIQDILYRRGCCYLQLKKMELALQDFKAHLELGPSPYQNELSQLPLPLLQH